MKLIIHDLDEATAKQVLYPHSGEFKLIANNNACHYCTGCFGCWTKTPAECTIPDRYQHIGRMFASCEEIILISQCIYGGYSPFIKNILDRSISYMLPFFTIRKGRMHHKSRYKKCIHFTTYFYGENITPNEKKTAKELIQANALNLNFISANLFFLSNPSELRGYFQ